MFLSKDDFLINISTRFSQVLKVLYWVELEAEKGPEEVMAKQLPEVSNRSLSCVLCRDCSNQSKGGGVPCESW